MSGIVIPNGFNTLNGHNAHIPKLPQPCHCCEKMITEPPYYWQTRHGKRKYYFVPHAVQKNIISWSDVKSLIERNRLVADKLKAKRNHTIATELPKNNIRQPLWRDRNAI